MTKNNAAPEKRKFRFFQIRWKEGLGWKNCPYAYRWVFNFGFFAIRIHKWIRSDDKRHYHNHPYHFITICLKGSYTDVSDKGRDVLKFGSIRFRKASHAHYVEVPKEGAITLLLTGPALFDWGFLVNGKLKRPLKYFHTWGHPPCDEQ